MVEATDSTQVDNLGSRFVEITGLERPRFELETPLTRFLVQALEMGVHLVEPDVPGLTNAKWERMVDIVILSTFGKEEEKEVDGEEAAEKEQRRRETPLERRFSLAELGEVFTDTRKSSGRSEPPGNTLLYTRERARQLIRDGVTYFYQMSPQSLKQQYPDLLSNLRRNKDSFMVEKAGITRGIAGMVLSGTAVKGVGSKYRSSDIGHRRKILEMYGLIVPYFDRANRNAWSILTKYRMKSVEYIAENYLGKRSERIVPILNKAEQRLKGWEKRRGIVFYLGQKYSEGLGFVRLKQLTGIDDEVIRKLFKRLGIPTRSQLESLDLMWNDKEFRQRSSAAKSRTLHALWKDDKYRSTQSQIRADRWKNQEYKDKRIQGIKNKWKDPVYQSKMAKVLADRWADPNTVLEMSEVSVTFFKKL